MLSTDVLFFQRLFPLRDFTTVSGSKRVRYRQRRSCRCAWRCCISLNAFGSSHSHLKRFLTYVLGTLVALFCKIVGVLVLNRAILSPLLCDIIIVLYACWYNGKWFGGRISKFGWRIAWGRRMQSCSDIDRREAGGMPFIGGLILLRGSGGCGG